jgi:FlaA1/EpsC-like NDP-sugar epimerase
MLKLNEITRARAKFVIDVVLWAGAGLIAFPLRQPSEWTSSGVSIPLYGLTSLVVAVALVRLFRLHRQVWRQITVHDLETLLKTVGIGTTVLFATGLFFYEVHGFPRTVPLIQGLLAIVLMGGVRLALRLRHERQVRGEVLDAAGDHRVLLVGAGDAGGRMARDMRRYPRAGLTPVGFLEDNPAKRRLTIAGLPVLGKIEDLRPVAREANVDEVLITMPSATGARTRRVVELAHEAKVRCRILPGVTEILAGEVDLFRARDVRVEDLLRRETIDLDFTDTGDYIGGRVVLVSGAGGSIGSEIVRQVIRLRPARVILMGQGENSLFELQQELGHELPDLAQEVIVGSVRDRAKLEEVMYALRPNVVFHAAAHKHIPLMERDPDEAILNNVGGTKNLVETALASGVDRFVNISTDKAVRPASMVGATKQIAEKLVRALSETADAGMSYVSVRFGNVLGSRGSVIPLFQEQLRRGGPITLTHPDMTRYFMTIPEASRLVIQAGALGRNGTIYMLDMGTPVRIRELADDMIRLSGSDPEDIAVVYTGLRPGEKLHEELFTEKERAKPTRFEKILEARTDEPVDVDFLPRVDALLASAADRDWSKMADSLDELVPGFELGDRGSVRRPQPRSELL